MRALERVVALLEAVAEEGRPVTPTAVAARVGLSLSTVSRLLRQLADEGLLERQGGDGAYVLGARLIAVARAAIAPKSLLDAARPELQALRDACDETVSLHVRRGSSRVCVAVAESGRPIRRVVQVGSALPVHAGASGPALLVGLADADLDELLATSSATVRERATARAAVAEAKARGWVATVDTFAEGVSAVAVPVGDSNGTGVVASLSVAGPSYRWTPEAMERFVPSVQAAAVRIAAALGPE